MQINYISIIFTLSLRILAIFYYRNGSAAQITSEFVDLYINEPVETWKQHLDEADIPNLRLTMCGYFGWVFTILYEPEVVDQIVDILGEALDLPEDIKIFCLQQVLPEIRTTTQNINLSGDEFFKLEGNVLSTGAKLIYAFLWQVIFDKVCLF